MSEDKPSFLQTMISSFGFAFEGVGMLVQERNFRIHLLAAALAIAGGFYFDIPTIEWSVITLTIAVVLMAEAFNSAIELICNRITNDIEPSIKRIKDISAAAVLFVAIGAAIIGVLIFLPKII